MVIMGAKCFFVNSIFPSENHTMKTHNVIAILTFTFEFFFSPEKMRLFKINK